MKDKKNEQGSKIPKTWMHVLASGLVLVMSRPAPEATSPGTSQAIDAALANNSLVVPVADVTKIVETERKERDFLLKGLGLSLHDYQVMLEKRKKAFNALQTNASNKLALSEYVEWLRRHLGDTKYAELVEKSREDLAA